MLNQTINTTIHSVYRPKLRFLNIRLEPFYIFLDYSANCNHNIRRSTRDNYPYLGMQTPQSKLRKAIYASKKYP